MKCSSCTKGKIEYAGNKDNYAQTQWVGRSQLRKKPEWRNRRITMNERYLTRKERKPPVTVSSMCTFIDRTMFQCWHPLLLNRNMFEGTC